MKKRYYKNFIYGYKGQSNMEFLILYLYIHWNDSVKYNINQILNIPAKIFFKKYKKNNRSFCKYSHKSLAEIRFKSFFNFNISQEFRNIFLLKNISRQGFFNYLKIIEKTPYNCHKKDIELCGKLFDEYYQKNLSNNTKLSEQELCCQIIYDIFTKFQVK